MSVRVSVADLDLRHEAGVAVAHHRIRRAAAAVCGNEPAASGLTGYSLYSDCRKAAFNGAVTDLHTQIASVLGPQPPKATVLATRR
jgi:UrcA family protein